MKSTVPREQLPWEFVRAAMSSVADLAIITGTQLFRYLLSVAGSVVVNYLFLKFFVELCGFWATPSQMMASLGTMTSP